MTQEMSANINTPGMDRLGTEELQILLDVSRSLHQCIGFDEMVSHAIKRVQEISDSETASILLYDVENDEFRFSWVVDHEHSAKLRKIRFPANEGIAGSVFKSGQPALVKDVTTDPRHYKKVDDDTGFETRSMIAVPLQGKEKPIGVMEVLNKRQGSFAEKDLFFISSMASLIGLALDNAAVHTELLNAYEEQSLEVKRTQEMNARLQRELEMAHQFDQIKGKSKPMLDVLRLAEKAVHSDIPVLIQGETGTGKELLARCIHYNSQRKHKPFLIQNCSAVSEQMLSSELFGHVQGAFGGAVGSKRGLLEAADGGTVFLDDIARMPQSVQLALLRVMDTGEIWPLGSEEPVQVDVRLIASVNKNLERFVKKDKFREDLFYRLSPFTLVIPPLRKRPEDIPVLAQHFVEELNEKNNTSIKGISRKAMNYLSTYPFPGNVRELKNEIERSIAMLDRGKLIDVRHLSEKLRGKTTPKLTRVPNAKGTTLKEKVEALEKAEIVRILGKNRGNKTATANELGLSRLGLSKKIKRYELQ